MSEEAPDRRKEERRKASESENHAYAMTTNLPLRRFNPRRHEDRERAAQ